MSTKNHFIPEHLEDEKQGLEVRVDTNAAHVKLSNCFTINYWRWSKLTTVKWKEENEETEIKETVPRIVSQGLRVFLSNRKTILTSLTINSKLLKAEIQNQISTAMENGLKLRNNPLQVKIVQFDVLDTEQVIALLKYMDPEVLTSIRFDSPDINKVINIQSWFNGEIFL
uniref:FTH domain-containing protein n=1 Tax=Caenorhabditis tropicalis TaxID=1561998 RepID=A0A1I7UDX5_9PELO